MMKKWYKIKMSSGDGGSEYLNVWAGNTHDALARYTECTGLKRTKKLDIRELTEEEGRQLENSIKSYIKEFGPCLKSRSLRDFKRTWYATAEWELWE